MSQSKAEFCKAKINELIDNILARESRLSNSQSYDDLDWIRYYIRDLTAECKDCAESHNDTPGESKIEE